MPLLFNPLNLVASDYLMCLTICTCPVEFVSVKGNHLFVHFLVDPTPKVTVNSRTTP